MNKKEIIEKLKNNMPKFTGTEEEIEVKTALYIYTELGKIKSFDERYYFGNSETRRKIYDLAEKQEENIEPTVSKRKLICVDLTHLYCNILGEFGIFAVPSEPEEGGHIHPIIATKSKKAFNADLQLDLENIQTKSRLNYFEYVRDINLNQEIITKMLIEMGYISDEKDYKDEEIKRLEKTVKEKGPHEALSMILEDEELYSGNEEMEVIEANKFYKRLLKKVIPNFLNKKIYIFNCYREREDKQKDYTICSFSEENDVNIYLFSKKDRRFLKVDISKMDELQKEGLVLGAIPKENGSNKLKKYIRNYNNMKESNYENEIEN